MHQNSTKRTKTSVYGLMGWFGCVRCQKFRRDFVARTFALVSARFAPSFVRQPNGPECTQIVRNTPKRHFRVQWGGSGAFIAKKFGRDFVVRTFALVSARFAPSFVRQPKGPECTQIVQNAPKRHFRVQWGGSAAFVSKNSDATSWHELLH